MPQHRKRRSAIDRLMSKIDVAGPDECWMWRGASNGERGNFQLDTYTRRYTNSARATYLLLVGPVSAELVVRHTCDVGLCCNPRHLVPGTQADNMRDRVERGRSRLGKLPHVELSCPQCGNTFDVIHSQGKRRVFCTPKCRAVFTARAVRHFLNCSCAK